MDPAACARVPTPDPGAPDGAYPREPAWAASGQVGVTAYRHDAIVMVAGGPAPSPYARAFDPYRLPRIQGIESELTEWLEYFDRHPGERYVSDGDPKTLTIPAGRAAQLRSADRLPAGVKVIEGP